MGVRGSSSAHLDILHIRESHEKGRDSAPGRAILPPVARSIPAPLLDPLRRGRNQSEKNCSLRGEELRPVTAVAVLEFPELGASAHFADGSQVKVALTNSQGEATFQTTANNIPGKYQPTITVNYLEQTSRLTLNQENAFPYPAAANNLVTRRRSRFTLSRKTLLLVCAGGASALVALVATRGHGTSSPSTGGITITPGSGTVGGAH